MIKATKRPIFSIAMERRISDEKSREWEKSGWKSDYSAARIRYSHDQSNDTASGDRKIPVVEERLNVGKREVSKRGVRVYSGCHKPAR